VDTQAREQYSGRRLSDLDITSDKELAVAEMKYVVSVYRFNFARIKLLTADLDDAQFTVQPLPGMNHPAWILGHLTIGREWVKDLLKLPPRAGWDGPAWMAKFDRGSQIVLQRDRYPSKEALLAALAETHREIETAVLPMTDADLAREMPVERIRSLFPRVGDMIVGLMTAHESFHMGQLSAWRRARGMMPLF
jgi:hypothetical protein